MGCDGDKAADTVPSLAHSFQLDHVVELPEVLDLEGSSSLKDFDLPPHYENRKEAASTFTLLDP